MKKLLTAIFMLTFFMIVQQTNAQVIINEISYNPPESGTDSLEYIEIYNAGNTAVDITGWYFQAGVEDTFPDFMLEPQGYFVTAVNAQAMMNVFGIAAHQWTDGGLNNSGEALILVDAGGNFQDSVTYDDMDPWPADADGSGPSLELRSPELDNNDGLNWQISGGATGVIINGFELMGTPGALNSGGGGPGPALTIELANFQFNPNIEVIEVGDVVKWVNTEFLAHNVNGTLATFPDNPEGFTNGPAQGGPWEFEHQFNVAGIYQYQCDPHAGQGMTGILYVIDPLVYNEFPLQTLRFTNVNGSSLFDGVPTTVTGVVHGINFQPTGYSFYIIDQDNIGINVFSFDPGPYTVQEGDMVEVSGVIDQFNGLLEIIPDNIEVLSTGEPRVESREVTEVTESDESSYVTAGALVIDSVVTTGTSGFNIFTTVHSSGTPLLVRVDADGPTGFTAEQVELWEALQVWGIGTQFDPSFPFTEGYQILALELIDIIIDGIPTLPVDAFQLNPNPASHWISLTGEIPVESVSIYSLSGQLVSQVRNPNPGQPLNVSHLSSGMYSIRVITSEGQWVSKLVVEK